jgi:hypothetical protein
LKGTKRTKRIKGTETTKKAKRIKDTKGDFNVYAKPNRDGNYFSWAPPFFYEKNKHLFDQFIESKYFILIK